METAVPFVNIECAAALAAEGARVTLIWNPDRTFFNIAKVAEVEELGRLIDSLRSRFEVVNLPSETEDAAGDSSAVDRLISENAVRTLHGEGKAEAFLRENPEAVQRFRRHVGQVRRLLSSKPFDWLLIPGGIWVAGGAFRHVCVELGIDYTTYDSGDGSLWWARQGVASQSPDLPGAFASLRARCATHPEEARMAIKQAWERLEERTRGEDQYKLQMAPLQAGREPPCDLLIPLNVRWDSAALLRLDVFPSVMDWLRQVLTWLRQRPGVTVAIRQHPGERLPGWDETDDWQSVLAGFPDLSGRVRFIKGNEKVNTYNLVLGAKVILPFTSRIGIEAAMMGKPVVLGSECYYSGQGFTWRGHTAAQYFDLVDEALAGRLIISPEARESAHLAYYILEKCLELRTVLTPMPADYLRWVEIAPSELWATPEIRDLLRALLQRELLAIVRYERHAAGFCVD